MFAIKKLIIISIAVYFMAGCSLLNKWVYRPDINQGNYVVQSQVYKLKKGLSKEQVIFIMGSPMLSSVYNDNIWYYVHRQLPTHGSLEQKTITLYFDNSGELDKFETTDINAN